MDLARSIQVSLRALIFSVLMAGFISAEPYVDHQNEFSLEIPAGWATQSGGAMPAGVALLLNWGETSQISVIHAKGVKDLQTLVGSFSENVKKMGYRHVEDRVVTVNQSPGHISVWKKGQSVIICTVVVAGSEGYLITNEVVDDYASRTTEYMQLVDSFRIVRGGRQPQPAATVAKPKDPSGGFGTDF